MWTRSNWNRSSRWIWRPTGFRGVRLAIWRCLHRTRECCSHRFYWNRAVLLRGCQKLNVSTPVCDVSVEAVGVMMVIDDFWDFSILGRGEHGIPERDLTLGEIYGTLAILILKPTTNRLVEVIIYLLNGPGLAPKKTHILQLGHCGRFAMNIVDDLIVVHHQVSWRFLWISLFFGEFLLLKYFFFWRKTYFEQILPLA